MDRTRLHDIPEEPESFSDENEKREPVIVEMDEELAIKDFEPIEKQRHFGLLHLVVTSDFRRMLVVGAANAILVVVFIIFILFFIQLHQVVDSSSPMQYSTSWCPSNFTLLVNNYCYTFINKTRHLTAEREITPSGGYLATMHDNKKAVIEFIKTMATSTENVWIGMYCTGNNMADCKWDDTAKVYDDNFGDGHPNTTIGLCVSFSVLDGKWYSTDCNTELVAVVETPSYSDKLSGCEYPYEYKCYFPVTLPMDFFNAQLYCNQFCARLASVFDEAENQWIQNILSNYDSQYYRLGGYATSKDYLLWEDGSSNYYTPIENFYGPGCIYMSYSLNTTSRGNWFTGDCKMNATFVCKKMLAMPNQCAMRPTTTPNPIRSFCNSAPLRYSGSFFTPNHPYPYPSFTNCTWTLITYGPQRISLTIENTSIGDGMIRVYDGESERSDSLANLTGSQQIHFLYSNGNVVFVKFEGGRNQNFYTGFNASFTTIF